MLAFRKTKAVLCYLIAGYHFDRRKLVAARKWMDRSLIYSINDFPYISVNNAILLLLEDQHSEAQLWFKRCQESLTEAKNANHVYLSHFCDFYLVSYGDLDRLHELEGIKARGLEANANKWLRQRFRFPSSRAIEDLIAKNHSGEVNGSSSGNQSVHISFSW